MKTKIDNFNENIKDLSVKKLNTLLSEINYFFWIHDRIPYFHTQIIYEKLKTMMLGF